MQQNTNPTTKRARQLRGTPNMAEQKLWSLLRNRQLGGYKFTRQYPVGPYFADFACRSHWLLVELDGSHHGESDYDAGRDSYPLAEGYSVLRFPSATVLRDSDAICETIVAAIEGLLDECPASPDLNFRRSKSIPRRVARRERWKVVTGR